VKFTVRPLQTGDLDALLALAQEVPEVPHWTRRDYEGRSGFVAESDNRIIGFSIVRLVVDICELESIAVVKEARSQGVGKALLKAVAVWASLKNAVRLELEVRASNTTAIRLYKSFGMRTEGLRPGYYSSPSEDALLMGMELGPLHACS
jgi:ribosomal-protein-alanine N-acetyltransferase